MKQYSQSLKLLKHDTLSNKHPFKNVQKTTGVLVLPETRALLLTHNVHGALVPLTDTTLLYKNKQHKMCAFSI